MQFAEIQSAVSDLPEVERGTLAAWLLDSLPPHGHEVAGAEGIAEAVRRREELDSGRVRSLNSDEFWASIEQARSTWT
jgi:hypothetical protein